MAGNIIGEALADGARAVRLAVPSVLWILVGLSVGEAMSRPSDEWLAIGMFLSFVWFAPLGLWMAYGAARIRTHSQRAGRAAGVTTAWVLIHAVVLLVGSGSGSVLVPAVVLAVPALLGFGIGCALVGRRKGTSPAARAGGSLRPPTDAGGPRMHHDDVRSRLRDEMMTRAANGFRGWTRPDGSYADEDGRRDYERAFGPGWRTVYEVDWNAAIAASASGLSSGTSVDPIEQAREWARLALEAEAADAGPDTK